MIGGKSITRTEAVINECRHARCIPENKDGELPVIIDPDAVAIGISARRVQVEIVHSETDRLQIEAFKVWSLGRTWPHGKELGLGDAAACSAAAMRIGRPE